MDSVSVLLSSTSESNQDKFFLKKYSEFFAGIIMLQSSQQPINGSSLPSCQISFCTEPIQQVTLSNLKSAGRFPVTFQKTELPKGSAEQVEKASPLSKDAWPKFKLTAKVLRPSFPIPNITILRNGEPLPEEVKLRAITKPGLLELSLENATRADSGAYEIKFKNDIGEMVVPMNMNILGRF
ncbi:unnamed protein product [Protopolystoma xenopodis]|uniref:Immunoglobulin I-set domain-containing protein n=1 Tax=Protopolystoma xenopodis TaxID=117903 RepID=A0A448WUW4_9PLAT|nr:unnamed protein product [Protopolystoma xenopodis]